MKRSPDYLLEQSGKNTLVLTLKKINPMVTVQLKILEEGIKHPIEQLKSSIAEALLSDDIVVAEHSNLELKIKFTKEDNQDLILLQLRDSVSKHKVNEKVIHYIDQSWKEDISSEAHALLASNPVSL